MKYRSREGLYVGIADLAELAEHAPSFFHIPWALVTMLDSSPVVKRSAETPPGSLILERSKTARILGNGILVSHEDILSLVQDETLFPHFDEIYLCEHMPTHVRIEEYFTSTGPRTNFGKSFPNEFLKTFRELGAVRYLSDGCGLNFVCENEEIVAAIERAEANIQRGFSYLGTYQNPPDV